MRCPECGHEDVRFHRLQGPFLEVICGLCELSAACGGGGL
jgi:ribosomal protein S27E